MICSRYLGGTLVWCDLSQIELRVAALLSGERTLLSRYQEEANPDLHTDRAESVFGIQALISKYGPAYAEAPGFKDLERQCGKHGNFTDLNWGSASVLQSTILDKGGISVPIEFCQRIVDARPTSRPDLWAWQNRMVEQAIREHRVVLPFFGQSRFFRGSPRVIRRTYAPTIINFPIQTHAANTLLDIQIRILTMTQERGLTGLLQTANIYDADILDEPPTHSGLARSLFQEAVTACATTGYWADLQAHTNHRCPLTFSVKEIRNP